LWKSQLLTQFRILVLKLVMGMDWLLVLNALVGKSSNLLNRMVGKAGESLVAAGFSCTKVSKHPG
jgi:hypothetical protein